MLPVITGNRPCDQNWRW